MQTAEAAIDRLCDPAAEVSAHYVICEGGNVTALVAEEMRAWHAGAGAWGAITDVNSHSIGIELANTGAHPFPHPQMQALLGVLAELRTRWGIAPAGVIGHSDLAVGRKIDPGPHFDWCALALQGHSIWPETRAIQPRDPAEFWPAVRRIGYHWADGQEPDMIAAFRSRFRPMASGPVDALDAAMACDLADRFGQMPID
jgi:N-acetylmuramoyl-L-alanine amidase